MQIMQSRKSLQLVALKQISGRYIVLMHILYSCFVIFLLKPLGVGAFPSTDHEFIPPNNSVLERAPCPGLNTLANHGFISCDGRNVSIA